MEIHIAFDVNVPHWINIFFFPPFLSFFWGFAGFCEVTSRAGHAQGSGFGPLMLLAIGGLWAVVDGLLASYVWSFSTLQKSSNSGPT